MIQQVHRDGANHHDFFVVVFENKDHVKVFQVELDTFKMDEFEIFQGDNKWWLKI